mgnify:CR=1 FL=1
MNILIILIIKLVYSYEFSFSKSNNFGNKFLINKDLEKIFNSNENIILESYEDDNIMRNNYINLYCNKNNINLININYNTFIKNNIELNNTFIYINDFLVKDGRILEEDEIDKILNYKKLLILGCDELSQVPFKDNNFLSKFKKIKIDKIEKKEMMHYIYSLIDYYNYDDSLMMINWNNYNIKLLDFEKVEKYLFLINIYISINKKLNKKVNVENIINKILNI